MASPPARTHHRQGDPVPDLDVVSSRPQSSAISERSIGRPGPRYERKFNPLVLGQNQTTADTWGCAAAVTGGLCGAGRGGVGRRPWVAFCVACGGEATAG